MFLWHWLLQVTGTKINPATGSSWYNWWSGFVGDLGILAGLVMFYKKVNCHVDGCRRIGLHHIAGGKYVVCRVHHPDHKGGRITMKSIVKAHLKHEGE